MLRRIQFSRLKTIILKVSTFHAIKEPERAWYFSSRLKSLLFALFEIVPDVGRNRPFSESCDGVSMLYGGFHVGDTGESSWHSSLLI